MSKYEYSMIVTTGELRAGAADATGSELSQSLAPQLGQLTQKVGKSVDTFDGGGWELVSHDITRIDRHLVTSFLLKRLAK